MNVAILSLLVLILVILFQKDQRWTGCNSGSCHLWFLCGIQR